MQSSPIESLSSRTSPNERAPKRIARALLASGLLPKGDLIKTLFISNLFQLISANAPLTQKLCGRQIAHYSAQSTQERGYLKLFQVVWARLSLWSNQLSGS